MDQITETDCLRTKYSLANPETHSSTTLTAQEKAGMHCTCTCRDMGKAEPRRCESRVELSHRHHHQIAHTETNGELGPHRNNVDHHTNSHHEGILNISCIRQVVKNLSGTYSMYQWSMFVIMSILLLSLHARPCSALPPQSSETSVEIDRISTTELEASNTNFHRVDEYLRFLTTKNDTNNAWSKIVRRSPYMGRGGKRSGRRASGKSRSSFSSQTDVMKRIAAESEAATCQPRDTVLDAYEELGIPKGYSSYIYPDCVVVKRCKNGGCCRDDEECQPAEHAQEEVSMLFLVNSEAIEKTIIQDTACECRRKPSFCPPPEMDCPNGKVWSYSDCKCTCRYRCPKPFLQDEDTCDCDCLMSNRPCKNISRGRKKKKLSHEECDCVRRGLCATPPCVNGRFSITACTCVQAWS